MKEELTELDYHVVRYDLLREARLKETQLVAGNLNFREMVAGMQVLNEDPFWEHTFNILELAIRELDPTHEYLPENHEQLD